MVGPRLRIICLLFALLGACENRKTFYEGGEPAAGTAIPAATGLDADASLPATGEVAGLGPQILDKPRPILVPGSGDVIKRKPDSVVQARELEGGEVTLNFVNASLPEVVQAVLGNILGLGYVIAPGVAGEVTVETAAPILRADLLSTFETVLKANGAALLADEGYYKVVPLEEAVRSAPPLLTNGPGAPLQPGFAVRIVPLRHVGAAEMESILEPLAPTGGILRADAARNILILAGSQPDLRAMMEAIDIFDVDWLKGMSFGIYPIEYADAATMAGEIAQVMGAELGVDLTSVVRVVPVERLNALLVISRSNDYVGLIGEWVSRLDRNWSQNDRRIFVYPVRNAKAADLAAIIGDLFGVPVPRPTRSRDGETVAPTHERALIGAEARTTGGGTLAGTPPTQAAAARGTFGATRGLSGGAARRQSINVVADEPPRAGTGQESGGMAGAAAEPLDEFEGLRVIADEANNALVILGTPEQFRTIEATLRRLDIVPLQVLIEATIAEVTLNDDLRYGVQWFLEFGSSQFNLSTIADRPPSLAPSGFSYLLTAGSGDVRVALDLLSEVSDVKVISSPHLMVLGNQTAYLQVGDQVPVLTRTAISTTSDEAPIVNEIEYRDTGIILTVTPRVNPGGMVTLEIDQEASSVAETTTGATESPTIQQRRISSTILVKSGESVALGGLIRDDVTKTRNGIPILKDLPVLGFLFGRTADLQGRTELVVILTPRVIANAGQAAQVTEELRSRMKGLRKWDKVGF